MMAIMMLAGAAPAQEKKPSDILPGRPDADVDTTADLLGSAFESKGQGIALRPPKGATPVRRVGAKDFIEFVDEARGWTLKISKIKLDKDATLTAKPDAHGVMQPGLLEFTAKRLKEEIPDAEFVRQDKVNIADADVGVLALRYTRSLKPLLTQQAIIQRTDRMYYLLALTTPGAPTGDKGKGAADTNERLAAEAFRQILDSVKLLDLAAVRDEQNKRLFSTRAMLLNLQPGRIRDTLLKPAEGEEFGKQWLRIQKKGKDIGYTFMMERTAIKGGQEGIEIRLRSRLMTSADAQVDAGSINHSSMDMHHEDWSTLSEFVNVKQREKQGKAYKAPQIAEFGISDKRAVPGQGDVFKLQVLYESTMGERLDPVERALPPFYLPQAISYLLPRLLPTNEPKSYMFMVYVPDTREVVMRYIDVQAAKKIDFNHQNVRAIPIEDRIGLEGSVTTHYVTSDHIWLGSENKETGITVVPSDEKTLLNLWKDANLTQPEEPQQQNNPKQRAAAEDRSPSASVPRK
jgi:hypothetical protein